MFMYTCKHMHIYIQIYTHEIHSPAEKCLASPDLDLFLSDSAPVYVYIQIYTCIYMHICTHTYANISYILQPC